MSEAVGVALRQRIAACNMLGSAQWQDTMRKAPSAPSRSSRIQHCTVPERRDGARLVGRKTEFWRASGTAVTVSLVNTAPAFQDLDPLA
jgi:hypothetical protein